MYSKTKGNTTKDYYLTPPPGYDGSRFRKRSDGRDDTFPLYGEQYVSYPEKKPDKSEDMPCFDESELEKAQFSAIDEISSLPEEEYCESPSAKEQHTEEKRSGILSFIKELPGEELLLIALIILLASNSDQGELDTVLLLALLLCVS